MQFKKIAIITIVSVMISGCVGVVLAYLEYKAKALVMQSLTAALVSGIGFKLTYQWLPKIQFNINACKKLFGFGTALLGSSVLNYWTRNTDNLLIGKKLGDENLGLYNRAYSFLLIPVSIVSASIGSVLFPLMAKNQDNQTELKRIFLQHTKLIMIIMWPVSLLAYLLSEDIVLGLLGQNWIELIPLFKSFAPLIFIQSMGTINGVIYKSLGKTRLLLPAVLTGQT